MPQNFRRIVIVGSGLLLLAVGVFFVAKYMQQKKNIVQVGAKNGTTILSPAANSANQALQKAAVTDTDLDGLSNDEEKKLGTDPNLADTDGDGLDDSSEASVFHTNPLKKDTLGIGHTDAWAVQHRIVDAGGAIHKERL